MNPQDLAARKADPQTLPMDVSAKAVIPSLPDAPFEPRGTVYSVASLDEFKAALAQIESSSDLEATIQLAADISSDQSSQKAPFAGIAGKTVMLSSVDDAKYGVRVSTSLQGGLVLDNVYASFDTSSQGTASVFANGNTFETTDRFSGEIANLYGGGSAGNSVDGDCNIVLRGGRVVFLYGGGLDSNVSGDVHITIDAPTKPGTMPYATVGTLHGGGFAKTTDQGRVAGDVTIDFLSGANGKLFGGGMNLYNPTLDEVANESAMVSGTVRTTFGYDGAPARSVWPGTAMFAYGGSESSSVGNVEFNLLDGTTGESSAGDRNFFAAGYNDTVLGTVKITVDGFDAGDSFVYFGGNRESGMVESDVQVSILNRNGEENAVTVRWNTPLGDKASNAVCGVQGSNDSVPLTIDGNVLVDVESGYLGFVALDSENGGAVINGDSLIRLGGNAKIAQVEGNGLEYGSAENTYTTKALVEGEKATAGYFYKLDEVRVTDGVEALVDGDPEIFPAFSSIQKPFFSVRDLVVDGEASLTTRSSNTQIKGDVRMDAGTWHAKGYVYVDESMQTQNSSVLWDTYYQVAYAHRDDQDPTLVDAWTSSNDRLVGGYNEYLNRISGNVQVKGGTWSLLSRTQVTGDMEMEGLGLQLPVIAEDANYPAGSIPLVIDGTVSGHADVVTVSRDGLASPMDASAWDAVPTVPALTENYICAWAPQGTGEGKEQDAPAQAVFTLDDSVRGDDAYYFKRLTDADVQRADDYYMWQVADGFTVTFDKNNTDEGSTDADPNTMVIESNPGDPVALGKLPGEPTRPGYTFDGWYADAQLTGERVTEATKVDRDVTFYAAWVKEPEPAPQTHKVTFVYGAPGVQDRVDTVEHGMTVDRPEDPMRPGFEFGGWFVDEAMTEAFDFSTVIVKDVTLYAKWTPVAVDPDGGEGSDNGQDQGHGGDNEPGDKPGNQGDSATDSTDKAPGLPATGDAAVLMTAGVGAAGVVVAAAGIVIRNRRGGRA